jgi:hypothetical protein
MKIKPPMKTPLPIEPPFDFFGLGQAEGPAPFQQQPEQELDNQPANNDWGQWLADGANAAPAAAVVQEGIPDLNGHVQNDLPEQMNLDLNEVPEQDQDNFDEEIDNDQLHAAGQA